MLYRYLAIAILAETIATSALKAPLVFQAIADDRGDRWIFDRFLFAKHRRSNDAGRNRLRDLVWCRNSSSWNWQLRLLGQRLDVAAVLGIALILMGVIVINVWSRLFFSSIAMQDGNDTGSGDHIGMQMIDPSFTVRGGDLRNNT